MFSNSKKAWHLTRKQLSSSQVSHFIASIVTPPHTMGPWSPLQLPWVSGVANMWYAVQSTHCGQQAIRCSRHAMWCGQSTLTAFTSIFNHWKFFYAFSAFLRAKNHYFQKVLKKSSSIQKIENIFITFLGGGVRPQSFFLKPSLRLKMI